MTATQYAMATVFVVVLVVLTMAALLAAKNRWPTFDPVQRIATLLGGS